MPRGRPKGIPSEKRLQLTGQVFGKLTVVGFHSIYTRGKKSSTTRWLCRCECGFETVVHGVDLKQGKQVSCGTGSCKNRLPNGEASFREIMRVYMRNAKARGINWVLTPDQFRTLIAGNCHYTVKAPTAIWRCKPHGYSDTLVWNGVDRLDSTKGYTIENCVPCCAEVNRAKMEMSHDDFVAMVSSIYQHRIRAD